MLSKLKNLIGEIDGEYVINQQLRPELNTADLMLISVVFVVFGGLTQFLQKLYIALAATLLVSGVGAMFKLPLLLAPFLFLLIVTVVVLLHLQLLYAKKVDADGGDCADKTNEDAVGAFYPQSGRTEIPIEGPTHDVGN